jgi:hypothetical protein
MPSKQTEAEKKLRKLSHYLRRGWQRQYPVPEKVLESVREVVRQQWKFEHQEVEKPQRSQQLEHTKRAQEQQIPPPTHKHRHGHSH